MLKAFISHSSKDKPFVRKLKEDLNFNEIETWVDEDELSPGDKLYDTLMLGLQNSSHFLIVLSNNIKNSHWVDTEINEAVSSLDKKTIRKIIPILLRQTEIPKVLQGLLYADFSSITFSLTSDGKVTCTGNKYTEQLERIVNAIKQNKDYKLTTTEINTIVQKAEVSSSHTKTMTNIVGLYEIAGFATNESRFGYVNMLKLRYKNSPIAKLENKNVIPVVLPNLLRQIFPKLAVGDELYFPNGDGTKTKAHFCGFSTNNTRIIVAGEIRKKFQINAKDKLLVGIDGQKREIVFYEDN